MTHNHDYQPAQSISSKALETLHDLQQGFHIIRAHDATPHILSREFRSAYGSGLEAEHTAMIEALGTNGKILDGTVNEESLDFETIQLLERKPTFFQLDPHLISEDLQSAVKLFQADESGVIMNIAFSHHPYFGGKIDSFPAIKIENAIYRILTVPTTNHEPKQDAVYEERLNTITLPSKVRSNENNRFVAMRFVEHKGHPRSISRHDLADWLDRYTAAGLDIGSDIGGNDASLDNFISFQGRLFWCDGDVVTAPLIQQAEQLQKVQAMKQKLEQFVR